MSTRAAQDRVLTVEEYLRFENQSPLKHEYVAGEIYLMVGSSKRHNRIAFDIGRLLDDAAEGSPYRVYLSDVKLRAAEKVIHYPDVMVTFRADGDDPYIEDAPCLIVEVVSPGTEATDRREKRLIYTAIPTLRAYPIAQDVRRVDRHWRDASGQWRHEVVTGEGTIPIPCPEGTTLSLDGIYARLD